MKNAFYFTGKALSILEIFRFLYSPPPLFFPLPVIAGFIAKADWKNAKVIDVILCVNRDFKAQDVKYLVK